MYILCVWIYLHTHIQDDFMIMCVFFSLSLHISCRTTVKNTFAYSISFGFSRSLIFFLYAIVFRFGAFLVTQPTDSIAYLSFYDMFRVFIAIVFGGAAIGQASAFAPDLTKAKLSANRIFHMLDRQPLIDNYSVEGEEKVKKNYDLDTKMMYNLLDFLLKTQKFACFD